MAVTTIRRSSARSVRYATLCRAVAAIASQQCAGGIINSKQLDDKFPLELVFLFARHVRTPPFLAIYVGRRQI